MRQMEQIAGSEERQLLRTLGLVAGLAVAVVVAGCSEIREQVAPTVPSSIDPGHTLPGGANVRSFDTATCNDATNTFTSGTEVCAKPTGLGNGFVGTLEWLRPDATVARSIPVNTNGSIQDRFTPDACGTWTLRLTHPRDGGGADVLTGSFEVTNCIAEACSPGFWGRPQHQTAYDAAITALLDAIGGTDSFNGIFDLTQAQTGLPDGYSLADALGDPGGTSPGPNPNNANFVGAGAILSAAHPDVDYAYTIAEVIAAVRGAYGIGAPDPDLGDLDATFEPGHVCPLGSTSGQ